MDISEYRQAVVEGFRSMVRAFMKWPENPVAGDVNRRLWGPWPWLTLGVWAIAVVGLYRIMPPFLDLVGLFPPLTALAYIPGNVRGLFWSAPAFFAFVIVWRVRRLRATDAESWPDRLCRSDFGVRFFEAGALPIAIAGLVVVIGIEVAGSVFLAPELNGDAQISEGTTAIWEMSFSSNRFAGNLVIIALISGILCVHREIGAGIGKLLGAGFFVWGIHIGIAFAVPWMVGWWSYLPVIGEYAPRRSVDAVHMLFDLAVALSAWAAAREKCRTAPLWSDAPPPPPPSAASEEESIDASGSE